MATSSWTGPLADFFGIHVTRTTKQHQRQVVTQEQVFRRPVRPSPRAEEIRRRSPDRQPGPMPRAATTREQATRSTVPLPGSHHPCEVGERYIIHSKAGKGAYGSVFAAEDTTTGEDVALKCITDIFRSTEDAKRALREATILRQCNHPNIIGFKEVLRPSNTEDFSQLWIVLERCDWDLKSVLTTKMKSWTHTHVEHLLHQILCGLAYLHANGVVHRDIKPANILVTRACEVRIADFGLARQIIPELDKDDSLPPVAQAFGEMQRDSMQQLTPPKVLELPAGGLARTLSRRVVTRYYRAPELLLGSKTYDAAIDIWSVGCILAEMLHSLTPPIADTAAASPPAVSAVLFPGESGDEYPSARTLPSELRKCHSMLTLQFSTLGFPSAREVEGLSGVRDDLRRSLNRHCSRMEEQEQETFGTIDDRPSEERLQERFPHAPSSAIRLLAHMLRYVPADRPRASECVCDGETHSFSDMLPRDRGPQPGLLASDVGCQMMSFPFENRRHDRHSLRQLILQEAECPTPSSLSAYTREKRSTVPTHRSASYDSSSSSSDESDHDDENNRNQHVRRSVVVRHGRCAGDSSRRVAGSRSRR